MNINEIVVLQTCRLQFTSVFHHYNILFKKNSTIKLTKIKKGDINLSFKPV